MADERVIEMLEDDIEKSKAIADSLDKLYFVEAFASYITKPKIKLLLSAANYLTANLQLLLKQYQTR